MGIRERLSGLGKLRHGGCGGSCVGVGTRASEPSTGAEVLPETVHRRVRLLLELHAKLLVGVVLGLLGMELAVRGQLRRKVLRGTQTLALVAAMHEPDQRLLA